MCGSWCNTWCGIFYNMYNWSVQYCLVILMYPVLDSREYFCTFCDNWVLISLIDIVDGLFWFPNGFFKIKRTRLSMNYQMKRRLSRIYSKPAWLNVSNIESTCSNLFPITAVEWPSWFPVDEFFTVLEKNSQCELFIGSNSRPIK